MAYAEDPDPYGGPAYQRHFGETVLAFWTPRRLAFPIFLILATYTLFMGWSAGLVDPDYYWHLKAGELIWAEKALPQGDPFSWSFEGRDWVLHEWLFQVALYLWESAFGKAGTAIATAVLTALSVYIAFTVADWFLQRPLVSFALALVFAGGIAAAGAPRPHMVSILFFAVTLALVFRAKYWHRHWGLLAIPVMMLVWVNAHGGYALGIAIMLAFTGFEWLNLLGRRRFRQQIWLCLWLTVVTAATVAASLVNPDGIEHWKYPLYVAQLDLVGAIEEWKSIMTSPARGLWYAGGAMVFFVILLGSDRSPDVTELLFPIIVFIAGLMQARHAPFATLTFLAFAGPALARETVPHPAPRGTAPRLLGWLLALAALAAVPAVFARSAYFEVVEQILPSDTVAFIEEADLQGRMFNDYDIGGYLIDRLHPERKVFIDGRADLYGDAFYKASADTLYGNVPLETHFDGWQIEYVIVGPRAPLVHMLQMRGDYRLVHRGRTQVVLIREGGQNAAALAKYPAVD